MKTYRPSNGTEGLYFEARMCDQCVRWRTCDIHLDVMCLDIDDPKYPKEWVQEDDGTNARCTAFSLRMKPKHVKAKDVESENLFEGEK